MSKKHYIKPLIQQIDIDNEISVLLSSERPPVGPGEDTPMGTSIQPNLFPSSPLHTSPSVSSSPFGGIRPDYQ